MREATTATVMVVAITSSETRMGRCRPKPCATNFAPNEDQDRGQTVVQVEESIDQSFQCEVEGSQPQDGEDDRRVGHEGGLCDREHRRH
jgi:hypothetical protein